MSDTMYGIMDNSNLSWYCLKCGLPNFSSAYFNQTDYSSFSSSNMFSILSDHSSPGRPNATSSPKHTLPRNSPIKANESHKFKNINHPLKVLTINFQSIKNKKPELESLIDSTNPDIIMGTETWLDPSIASSEYFPAQNYNVYRKDRPPNSKGQSHGGVLLAIKSDFKSMEVVELQTQCEIVWAEVTINNARKLTVGSFYRPQPNDDTSLNCLNESLHRINTNSKSITLIGGDFNLGNIDWDSSSTIPGRPNINHHQELLDIVADHSLTQVVNKPTRNDKILDLLLTNYPSIVNNIETIPPIGEADHDIVFTECNVSLRRCKNKPRETLKYSKANWSNIKEDLAKTYDQITNANYDNIDDMWNIFKSNLLDSISKHIPTKLIKNSNHLT